MTAQRSSSTKAIQSMKNMEKQAIISGTVDIAMYNLFSITEHSIKFQQAYGRYGLSSSQSYFTRAFPAAKLYKVMIICTENNKQRTNSYSNYIRKQLETKAKTKTNKRLMACSYKFLISILSCCCFPRTDRKTLVFNSLHPMNLHF